MRSKRWLGASLGMLLLATLVMGPRALSAEDTDDVSYEYTDDEGPLKECYDRAQAEYNTCLQGAGSGWERMVCDLIYQSDIGLCVAEYVGRVKKAASGGEEEEEAAL